MKTQHDGDCWIFATNGVCTCGYFRSLVGTGKEPWKDPAYIRHHYILNCLNGHHKIIEPAPVSPEEMGNRLALIRSIFPDYEPPPANQGAST